MLLKYDPRLEDRHHNLFEVPWQYEQHRLMKYVHQIQQNLAHYKNFWPYLYPYHQLQAKKEVAL